MTVIAWLAGFIMGAFVTMLIFSATEERTSIRRVGNNYRACIALGAPPENCLKKYVLGEDEK